MEFDSKELIQTAADILIAVGLKVIGALLIWIVGRWLVGFAKSLADRTMVRRDMDKTVREYVSSSLGVLLNIVLIAAILGFFGVETTTFAAVLASAGLAIGLAWSGLLANFAGGIFLVVLRPFKVGDFVTVGGVTGTVVEIGLFVVALNTPDNVRTIVGNSKVFGGDIANFSANPHRRVDLVAQLSHDVDHNEAIATLKASVAKLDNVLSDPAVDVEILEFNLAGPVLAVRPYCHTDHYWQVYFDTNRTIREEFSKAGYPVPEHHYLLRNPKAA